MSEEINHSRRHFLAAAGLTIAGTAGLGFLGDAGAGSGTIALAASPGTRLGTPSPATDTSFGPLTQIDAGVLNVGYA